MEAIASVFDWLKAHPFAASMLVVIFVAACLALVDHCVGERQQ
jgi:hypothetical protein